MADCDEFLNLMAIADAYHDFRLTSLKVDPDVILEGLYCDKEPEIDEQFKKEPEDSMIKRMIGYDNINALESVLKYVSNNFLSKDITTINGNKYTVKILYTEITTESGIKKKITNIKTKQFRKNINDEQLYIFFNNHIYPMRYQIHPTILIDTDGINILKLFSDTRAYCNKMINRELINDSANKNTSKLHHIWDTYDISEEIIKYNTTQFNTNYEISLDKIDGIDTEFKLTTEFKIKKQGGILYETSNSNDNQKHKCRKKIQRAKSEGDTEKQSVFYQVKRSGDWLQALSILDTERDYTIDENKGDSILITCDRVLLCYCLLLGINVVYTRAKDGELFYFNSHLTYPITLQRKRERYPFTGEQEKMLKKAGIINGRRKIIQAKKLNKEQKDILGIKKFNQLRDLGFIIGNWEDSSPEVQVPQAAPSQVTPPQVDPAQVAPPQVDPPQVAPEPSKPSAENISDVMRIMNEYTRRENRGISNIIAEKQFFIRFIDLLKSKPILREQLRNYMSKGKPEEMDADIYELITKALEMNGGSMKPHRSAKKLCNDYLTELKSDIECFDSEDNSDYDYYEKVALVVLACLNEYRTSANVYEQMQAILFDILPSIEGYIKCKEPEVQQFFNDDYVADCMAYAARNIALHSLGLRTGKIEDLGNREKHSVKIPPSAVDFYKRAEKHLEKSTFEERKVWIIEQLQAYQTFMHSPKRASSRKASAKASKASAKASRASASRKAAKASASRKASKASAKAISVGGSTRRKSRK
jgi:hypothetical protein